MLTTHVHIGTWVPVLTTCVRAGVCALTTHVHTQACITHHTHVCSYMHRSVYCTPVRTHHTCPHMQFVWAAWQTNAEHFWKDQGLSAVLKLQPHVWATPHAVFQPGCPRPIQLTKL